MLRKLSQNERRALFIFVFLITSDILLYLFHGAGYDPVPYLSPPGFYILLYNLTLICIFLILIKEGMLIILISPFLVIILGMGLYFFSFMGWKYEFITSPSHTAKVVVKYSGVLDQYNETYRFYQITFMGLLITRLEVRDDVDEYSDFYNTDESEIDNLKWMNEKEIIFRTRHGDKRIKLK